jgi:hypothetical protein
MIVEKISGYVVQSNKLVEAHYRLGLQEKRLILISDHFAGFMM